MKDPALQSTRTDPIVDRYVTTDQPVSIILETVPEPRSMLLQALLYIHECLDGKRLARQAIDLAQAVPLKGWDPELLILFLSAWAELSCRIGRPTAAESLLHQAKSFISGQTHPEVRAAAILVESILADTTGNKKRSESLLKEVIKTVAAHSPRRKNYIWELCLFLGLQGRGIESQAELKELSWQGNDRYNISRMMIVQFTNAVETGRAHEASQCMSELRTSVHNPMDLSRIPYKAYQDLLALMHTPPGTELMPLPDLDQRRMKWVAGVHALLRKNSDEALKLARIEANRLMGSIFTSGFDSFSLVRAELAAGNGESALRLVRMRQGRGNAHYLDDFFIARAELLSGNARKATQHFADSLMSIEGHKAEGRLDFELRLACELTESDILKLTRKAESKLRRSERSGHTKEDEPAETAPESSVPTAMQESEVEEFKRLGVDIIRGKSKSVDDIRREVTRFADLDAPVLITGETGTGKELVARALHLMSKRRRHPFTVINCGSITETLLESELFGHERGAFTGAERTNRGLFEATGSGTILLDEIGDVSPRLQSTLLRVLETGEIRAVGSTEIRRISCRIVAATNVNLTEIADQDKFRMDLFYRLQRLGVHVPPLRERREDVMPLARYFLDVGRRIGAHAKLSSDLRDTINAYDWPGNVRELRNVIERMRLMHSDKLHYGLEDLDLKFQPAGRTQVSAIPIESVASPSAEIENTPPKQLAKPQAPVVNGAPLADHQIEQVLSRGSSQLRRMDRLRKVFQLHEKLTRKEVTEILAISPNTATKYLKNLCDDGFIRCVEPTQSSRSRYFVIVKEQLKGDA